MVKIKKNKIKPQTAVEMPEEIVPPPKKRSSEDPVPQKTKWINKQRVLVFASRGINYRHRHLMEDLKKLMPHHKAESKMERSKTLFIVNEICEGKNCNKALLFEGRRKSDLYMWLSNIQGGPCVKFLIENVYTMDEMKLTGNCLRGSRPLLSFSPAFAKEAHYQLMKELLTQIFGVPNQHPKSQPFFDRVYNFSVMDNRIWFRHYQILSEDGALVEIGPRFIMNPVKIFGGSFGGVTLWENPHYLSPAKYRQVLKKQASNKYINRVEQKAAYEARRSTTSYNLNDLNDIFAGDIKEAARKITENKNISELNEEAETQQPLISKIKKSPKKKEKTIVETLGENEETGKFVKLKRSRTGITNIINKKSKLSKNIVKAKTKKIKVKFASNKINDNKR